MFSLIILEDKETLITRYVDSLLFTSSHLNISKPYCDLYTLVDHTIVYSKPFLLLFQLLKATCVTLTVAGTSLLGL